MTTPAAGRATTWKVDVAFDQLRYVVVCSFKSDGAKLAGPCAVSDGSTLRASGASDGPNFTLGYDTEYQGRPVHVAYTGVVKSDNTLSGAVNAGDSAGTFTAAHR